jgi:DNA-binding XRE family transcriptional regulator
VQRKRIRAGKLEPGDVAALRRFVCLTQERFAEALGISVHTLRNWEQDRVQTGRSWACLAAHCGSPIRLSAYPPLTSAALKATGQPLPPGSAERTPVE